MACLVQAQTAQDKAGDYTQAAKDKAGDLTGSAKDTAGQTQDKTGSYAQTAKDKASSAADTLGSKVRFPKSLKSWTVGCCMCTGL